MLRLTLPSACSLTMAEPGGPPGPDPARSTAASWPVGDAPFVAGEIADRGPVERGAVPVPLPRAREVRELERQGVRQLMCNFPLARGYQMVRDYAKNIIQKL